MATSGARDPLTRPRPVPKAIRAAIEYMVYGKPDDPDAAPIDFVQAAKLSGLKPYLLRRYLDRPEVRALLLAERRAFRALICSGNELALRKVRDGSNNDMGRLGAVRVLEQIDHDDTRLPASQSPGVTIVIHPASPSPAGAPTIDVTPHRDPGDRL